MKHMVLVLMVVFVARPAGAQGFTTEGSVTAGYRFADVADRRQKFDELFNLRTGPRIHNFEWRGQSSETGRFADSYSVSGYGFGGEPFAGSEFRMSRAARYDVRARYRQNYYYWDRNDQNIQPSGVQGLTNHHNWATVRRIGSVEATFDVAPALRLGAEYELARRDGDALSTRTLEYFGAPSTFGNFLRANPYLVEGPVDASSHRGAGRISYTRRDWNFHYKAGYQRHKEEIRLQNLFPGQRSINVDEAATANELLELARWTESRRLSAPFSEFSYNGTVLPRLRLRGGYLYYRYAGPSAIDAEFTGLARTTNASTIAPYDVQSTSRGVLREPNHIFDQGFTVDVHDGFRLHADYRYSRFSMENLASFDSTDGAGTHSGETEVGWRYGLQTLDIAVEWAPLDNLILRPGLRLMKRDVTVLFDDIADARASRPSKIASPLLSVYYAPSRKLTLRGDMRNSTNGGPYTRISPRTDRMSRWVLRYSPIAQLSLENAVNVRNSDYTTADFAARLRSNATSVHYTVSERLALLGGFTYDSFLATADIRFLRGTAPLETNWRDQTISRVWEAGIEAHPFERLEIQLSANYLRTTGAGEISGEPPTYGPLRWPRMTGTITWDAARAGSFALELERTYYIEEILRGNNFSANVLGLRWTREF
jgi:hypothetical protein